MSSFAARLSRLRRVCPLPGWAAAPLAVQVTTEHPLYMLSIYNLLGDPAMRWR